MRPAFHTYQTSPAHGGAHRLVDVLERASEAGFTRIGFDTASLDAHRAAGGELGEIRSTLSSLGLGVTDILYLAVTDDRSGDEAIAERRLADALALGASWCLVAVPEPVGDVEVRHRLRDLGDRFGAEGVKLAIEFTSYAHLADLASTVELCEEVGWDRCGVVLDSLHFFRSGADWDSLGGLANDQIAYVQLADAPSEPPASLREESRNGRMLPGAGGLPLADLLDEVRRTGFDGDVVAEVLSEDLRARPLVESVRRTYEALAGAVRDRRPGSGLADQVP